MKFLEKLFKKKEKPQEKVGSEKEEIDIKPLIPEFIKSGALNSIKSKKVLQNVEFILNTLLEAKMEKLSEIKVMGLLFKIRERIGMDRGSISDMQKLLKLFLKFLDEKGLITEEIKNKMKEDGDDVFQSTIRREGPKIGRNEPCRCGSGKKYKLCCGR